MSLSGAKRTRRCALHMSASDPKRTCVAALHESAFDPKRTFRHRKFYGTSVQRDCIADFWRNGQRTVVLNHWRSNMMKFPSTLDEENLLTYQVSDEALETAGGNEIAGSHTLAYCTGVYCNFVVLRGSLFSAER